MAERRPVNLDQMAAISGVGAKKLERYGAIFLTAISGEMQPQAHPARRKLAGTSSATTFDHLVAAQLRLVRGSCGTLKPLECSPSLLAHISSLAQADRPALIRLLGAKRAERFADAFLDVLANRSADAPAE